LLHFESITIKTTQKNSILSLQLSLEEILNL
jgi:hypothetical protein